MPVLINHIVNLCLALWCIYACRSYSLWVAMSISLGAGFAIASSTYQIYTWWLIRKLMRDIDRKKESA